MQEIQTNLSPQVISTLFRKRSGKFLNQNQIAQLRRRGNSLTINGSNTSAADRLMQKLSEDPGTHYYAYVCDRDDSGLITIRNVKRKAGQNQIVADVSPPYEEETLLYVDTIIDALSLDSGTKLLLAVSWVTDEAITYLTRFPSVIGLDVTHGTNSEKRPLARGTAKTYERKNIPFYNCFLPYEIS